MAVESTRPAAGDSSSADEAYEREARDWFENVYQGDTVRQLSVRSIVSGMLIGGVMSISNLYVGLKTGWGLGVTITACIIAFAVFRALETLFESVRRDPFTILENYTMSSAASAAGYMSTSGLVSSIPALYLTTGRTLVWWEMMSWLAALSFLGVFMAVPLKRQLINIDKLPFPTGIATAETLRSMHTSGAAAIAKARALLAAGILGAVVTVWRDGFPLMSRWLAASSEAASNWFSRFAIPATVPLAPNEWGRALLDKTSLGFEGSMIMVAAGAIMGIRVGASLLAGAVIYFGLIGSVLVDRGITGAGYDKMGINAWSVWPATAMMVTYALVAFVLRWRTVVRAFQGMATMFGGSRRDDPLEQIEVPGSWFVVGTLVSGAACVILGQLLFDIHWLMGVVAVLLTFVLSIVAARATGETDVTPISAMGKITQLLYGTVAPTNITTNLMTASITAGASAHSADLLTDLKSGYLLGGNPRKQTISQLFGVLAGTLVCVPVYSLIADPEKLGSQDLPAPSAKVWAGVAEMLAHGLEHLPEGALAAMLVGGLLGIVLALAEEFTPERHRKWIPSAIGLGVAGVIPAFNSISMFVGALTAWLLAKWRPKIDEAYTIPVSSGLIAGESLMGVVIIAAHELPGALAGMRDYFSAS
jgi:putative OPT family oligopeptide transporter